MTTIERIIHVSFRDGMRTIGYFIIPLTCTDVRPIIQQCMKHRTIHGGQHIIIIVHKGYKITLAKLHTPAARVPLPLVFLAYISDSSVPFLPLFTNLPRTIRASIIYQDDFQIPVSLGSNTVQTSFQELFRIINRDNDRYKIVIHAITPLSISFCRN